MPLNDEAERDLQMRIDDNIFRLIEAGHDFSPAGLVKGNRIGLSDDELVGRTAEPPKTHELDEAVAGEIVVGTGGPVDGRFTEAELRPYVDALNEHLTKLTELTGYWFTMPVDDDCDGDPRYAAPGRGHAPGCTYPAPRESSDG